MLANPNTTHPDELACNEQKRLALELYDKYFPNVAKVMKEMGMRRETFWDWKRTDPQFSLLVSDIEQHALGEIENNLFSQGRTNKKAIVPMIFILKTWKREIYGDKLETYNTNQNMDLSEQASKTLDQAKKRLAALEEKQIGGN